MDRLSQPVSMQTALAVALGLLVLSTAAGTAFGALVLERGERGPSGPPGPVVSAAPPAVREALRAPVAQGVLRDPMEPLGQRTRTPSWKPSSPIPTARLKRSSRASIRTPPTYDGQRQDGFYHYTGEGQVGDQQMAQGNRAIRDHKEEGRHLRLFTARAGEATFVGEFEYVDHYLADAPSTGDGPIRSVIVFRLRALDGNPATPPSRIDQLGTAAVKEVPVERHLTERTIIEPGREPIEAERREQRLVEGFQKYLVGQGREVCRLQLRPPGEPAPIFCDMFDKTTNAIIEAKGSVARPPFRMAVGQLLDYARLVDPAPRKIILVPQEPRRDLIDFAESAGIAVVWPQGNKGFATSNGSEI